MAYKSLSTVGIGFEVETFDPELKGKYVARYRKIDQRKNGVSERDGWLMWPVVNGKRYHEFFADINYNNSPAESLVAIIRRRDEVLDLRDPHAVPYSEGLIGSNFSGRNGVSFAKERYKKGAKGQKVVHQSACWCATWTDLVDGKKRTTCKKFSIKKYGFWDAYKQAVYARWNWENSIRAEKGLEPQTSFGIQKAPWMKEMDLEKEFLSFSADNAAAEFAEAIEVAAAS